MSASVEMSLIFMELVNTVELHHYPYVKERSTFLDIFVAVEHMIVKFVTRFSRFS